jgi:hypothetical protein
MEVMMHKHTITMNKPWPSTASTGLQIHGIIAKLRNAVRIQIPVAYQDETGFHMGVKPAGKEANWPSVW